MSSTYRTSVKDSVVRNTPLTEEDIGDDRHLEFTSKARAEDWIEKQNRSVPCLGRLTLRRAHPEDGSDVDAYVVFQPATGLGDSTKDRQTEVVVGGHGLRSGTLMLDEAKQDLLTFAYASGDYAVLVLHSADGDPLELVTIDLETLGEHLWSGLYHGIDVV